MASELEHVVCVARFSARRAKMLREVFWRKERLVVAVTAYRVRTMMCYAFPEETCDVVITLLSSQLKITSRANGFRDLCICVHTVERVLAAREGVEDPLVIELSRDSQVFLIAGHRVQVRQHLLHSPEFGIERALLLLISQAINAKLHPIGHFSNDLERFRAVTVKIDVKQSSHYLVQRVIRRPDLCSPVHPVEELFRISR